MFDRIAFRPTFISKIVEKFRENGCTVSCNPKSSTIIIVKKDGINEEKIKELFTKEGHAIMVKEDPTYEFLYTYSCKSNDKNIIIEIGY